MSRGLQKMTAEQVAECVQAIQNGETYRKVADKYGVNVSTIQGHVKRSGVQKLACTPTVHQSPPLEGEERPKTERVNATPRKGPPEHKPKARPAAPTSTKWVEPNNGGKLMNRLQYFAYAVSAIKANRPSERTAMICGVSHDAFKEFEKRLLASSARIMWDELWADIKRAMQIKQERAMLAEKNAYEAKIRAARAAAELHAGTVLCLPANAVHAAGKKAEQEVRLALPSPDTSLALCQDAELQGEINEAVGAIVKAADASQVDCENLANVYETLGLPEVEALMVTDMQAQTVLPVALALPEYAKHHHCSEPAYLPNGRMNPAWTEATTYNDQPDVDKDTFADNMPGHVETPEYPPITEKEYAAFAADPDARDIYEFLGRPNPKKGT